MSAKVLLIENNRLLAHELLTGFRVEGFHVATSGRREDAQTVIAEERPDLVVIDCQAPVFSRLELCRQIRRSQSTQDIAIIMLSPLGEEADVIRGLGAGADHYMVKPCSVREVVARARSILGRTNPARVANVLTAAGVLLNRGQRRVYRDGCDVEIGPTEFRLLEFMMENQDRVLTRSQILDGVWGRDAEVNERTVDVHIGRLRKVLGPREHGRLVRTVRSMGYAFETSLRPASSRKRESAAELVLTKPIELVNCLGA